MSHFTNMKTRFQNLFYLEKALTRLDIQYKRQLQTGNISITETNNTNLVIAQPNGYDITFCWNGQEYELVADMSYWKQPYPVESFIDKVGQQYAGEAVIGESQKIGFQPIKYQQNEDGSNTLVLERWNGNNL
jgi:hypothetical protein